MNKRISSIFILATVIILAVIWSTPASATQATCPQTGGWAKVDNLSGQSYTYTPPAGYHVTDNCYKAGQSVIFGSGPTVTSSVLNPQGRCCQALSHASFLIEQDEVEPTATPIPTATEIPQPTETEDPGCQEQCETPTDVPTDVPYCETYPEAEECQEPTEEPTAEPTEEPTVVPTDEPPPPPDEPEELPKAGLTGETPDVMNGEAWLVGKKSWAGHNQEGWQASKWWMLWVGKEFFFQGQWYIVTDYIIADPSEVDLIDGGEDITLITCRGYDPVTNTWAERLVIYAELSD